jgi:hypothetical protein
MKICFKCKKEKPLCEYYKHNQMADGHVNKCKDCNKLDVKKDYYRKSKSIEFIEKERERGREKYHRLNYKERSKELNKDKPWKHSSKYKGLNKKFKVPKGFELHHWSYNNEDLEDVIIMKIKEHRQAHTHLTLDLVTLKFKTKKGKLLSTKIQHLNYLIKNSINF